MAGRGIAVAAGAVAGAVLAAAGFALHGALDAGVPAGGGDGGLARQLGEVEQRVSDLAARIDALEPMAGAGPLRAEEPAAPRVGARDAGATEVEGAADVALDANGRRAGGRRRDAGLDELRRLRDAPDDAARLAAARELSTSGNPMVALESLRVLSDLAPKEALALVDAWVAKEKSGELSGWQVERALVALADGKGAAQIGAELTEALRRYYRDGDAALQLTAARALDRRGDSGAMQHLVTQLGSDLGNSDVDRRAKSIDALAQTRSHYAAPLLLPLLADPSDEVRLRTLDALRRTGDAATIEKILPLLNDPVAAVRDRATRAIESLRRGDGQDDRRGGGNPFGGRRRPG
jgi:HEAT repeat protein